MDKIVNRKQRRFQESKQKKQGAILFEMAAPHLQLLSEAIALQKAGNLKEAENIYKNLQTLYPNDATIAFLLGLVNIKEERFVDGLNLIERATQANPEFKKKPEYADAYCNYGSVLWKDAKYEEALSCFDKAIALNPTLAIAHLNKALIHLTLGEFNEGWHEYEWRWKSILKNEFHDGGKPLWLGQQSLDGKTLLLYPEQGFGDTIQLCRFIPQLEKWGANIVIGVREPLRSLISTLKGKYLIVSEKDTIPEFDLHCPLFSLPLALGVTLETIPADIPYLYADSDKLKEWQTSLGKRVRPRIGLVWSGAQGHLNDHNRTIALNQLMPLLENNYEFHSLQKEIRPADEALFSASNIVSHASELKDFSDTAALVVEMDIIITVDTSVAHLAGALGKPVWILLPFVPDFRWMLEREDSPWYPTVKLFRQSNKGEWAYVIGKIITELAIEFAKK